MVVHASVAASYTAASSRRGPSGMEQSADGGRRNFQPPATSIRSPTPTTTAWSRGANGGSGQPPPRLTRTLPFGGRVDVLAGGRTARGEDRGESDGDRRAEQIHVPSDARRAGSVPAFAVGWKLPRTVYRRQVARHPSAQSKASCMPARRRHPPSTCSVIARKLASARPDRCVD